jgi:ATP-dependent DNA helicase RecG
MEKNSLIEEILTIEEGQVFECKRVLKKPSEVLPTICAFANTDGGVFVYGLEDAKKTSGKERLKGIAEARDNCDELLKLIANDFVPPLPKIESNYLDIVNAQNLEDRLLIISVDASKTVHSLRSGQTYIRRGSQNNLLTHEQAMQLQYEKGTITFESELAKNVTLKDLDNKAIEEFMNFNKSEEKDILRFFLNNGLAEEVNGRTYLNNAAVLLFAVNPFVSLKRKCAITIIPEKRL